MVNDMTGFFKWIWNLLIALNLYATFTDNSTFRRLLLSLVEQLRVLSLYLADKIR